MARGAGHPASRGSIIEMNESRESQGERRVSIADLVRNNVKEKLERDEVVAAMTVRLVRSGEIARIAQTAGFDTLYVHGAFEFLCRNLRTNLCRGAGGRALRRSCAFRHCAVGGLPSRPDLSPEFVKMGARCVS